MNNIDFVWTMLFLFASKAQMIYAKRYTKRVFEEEGDVSIPIHFTTVDDVKKYGVTGEVWE